MRRSKKPKIGLCKFPAHLQLNILLSAVIIWAVVFNHKQKYDMRFTEAVFCSQPKKLPTILKQ